ncbi:AAA family ATPase [Brucella tritici]|uniref:AAA family ATPase n=1 Tax=Brucella tritici TaxID=94626 RepID=A0A6L3YW01_9HYPH|nr:AAA family ATPase [Brucella tritici]KAB2689688.1 AAA family ATPase [Brucella tritici]
MADNGDKFAGFAGEVARELLGEPNKHLSTTSELRFGNKGSVSIDLEKGTWFDHGENTGGGVLALIEKETGRKGREAVEWLREKGFHVEDKASSSNRDYVPDNGKSRRNDENMRPVKTWDYVDEKGALLFQVVRLENGETGKDGKPEKTYRQRRPDPSKGGGWNWSTKDVRQVPYRLPDLQKALDKNHMVFVVEGEKAADKLLDLGVPATTNARGAGKWLAELSDYLKGARVVVLADDDPQARHQKTNEPLFHDDGRPKFVGIDHANSVAASLLGKASDVRVVQLTDNKKKEDVVDWLDDGHTVEELYQIAAKAPKFIPPAFKSKFNAVPWDAFDAPAQEHEYLIKGILTRGEVSIASGASKSGKTFLILDAAMAVARGVNWMGRKARHGGVIYQAGEGQKGLRKRIKAYRQWHGLVSSDNLPFVFMPARLNLYQNDDQTNEFIEEAKHWASTFNVPLELVVIDTWATATVGANENDGKDVGSVLERGRRISEALNCHVLFVHHMNADGTKVRGHSSLIANLENALIVRLADGLHDEDGRQIREVFLQKNKEGEDGITFRFALSQVKIGKDEDGDPITSCVVVTPKGEGSDEAPEKRPNISDKENVLLTAIQNALAEHGTDAPPSMGLPGDVRIVHWQKVIEAFDKLDFEYAAEKNDDEKTRQRKLDARRKELGRRGERLFHKGLIARDSPHVWLTPKAKRRFHKQEDTRQPITPTEPSNVNMAAVEEAGVLWGND